MVCGTTEDLQFDHVDATTKVFDISAGIRDGYGRVRLVVELAKCQLLCGPHHREKTRAAGEHRGGHNKIVNPEHGTAVMYGKPHNCRCPVCQKWKSDYRARLVDSRGQAVVAQLV